MAEHGSNCEETLAEVQRFLDGELDRSLQLSIEHHLSGCDPCMQRTEFRRHLKVMISAKCVGDAVPDALHSKIMDLIRGLDEPAG